MAYSTTDIVFAGLLANKVAESLPRLNDVQNELMKHVLPPIPFLSKNTDVNVKTKDGYTGGIINRADPPPVESDQFFPISFSKDGGPRYLLPYEPMISINGGQNYVLRNTAKTKTEDGNVLSGGIIERWSQKNIDVTITGVLMGSIMKGTVDECFPREDFEKLRNYINGAVVNVYCEPLQLLGINRLFITDFSYPFTKGENVQAYELKCLTDHDFKLLLDIDD